MDRKRWPVLWTGKVQAVNWALPWVHWAAAVITIFKITHMSASVFFLPPWIPIPKVALGAFAASSRQPAVSDPWRWWQMTENPCWEEPHSRMWLSCSLLSAQGTRPPQTILRRISQVLAVSPEAHRSWDLPGDWRNRLKTEKIENGCKSHRGGGGGEESREAGRSKHRASTKHWGEGEIAKNQKQTLDVGIPGAGRRSQPSSSTHIFPPPIFTK